MQSQWEYQSNQIIGYSNGVFLFFWYWARVIFDEFFFCVKFIKLNLSVVSWANMAICYIIARELHHIPIEVFMWAWKTACRFELHRQFYFLYYFFTNMLFYLPFLPFVVSVSLSLTRYIIVFSHFFVSFFFLFVSLCRIAFDESLHNFMCMKLH